MKKILWISLALVLVVIITLVYLDMAAWNTAAETSDGVTYYPDGSYSYQVQYPGGQITQITVYPDGHQIASVIQMGAGIPETITDGTKK